MDNYLLLKMVPVLSATVIAGTGTGIAFFMLMAHRSGNLQTIAVTARHVVLADWIFTTPAVITQFLTGVMLMMKLGYSFTSTWFLVVISLFLFIGVCWLPVVLIQYRLKSMAEASLASGTLEPAFHRLMR
jgi:uncharacterized membrane protein